MNLESGVWSLGLLQLDFYYRRRQWYAGQYVRKIIPTFDTTENNALFFTTILNKIKPILSQVLVRDIDKTFKKTKVALPVKNGEVDFEFIELFVNQIKTKLVLNVDKVITDFELVSNNEN